MTRVNISAVKDERSVKTLFFFFPESGTSYTGNHKKIIK